MGHSFSISLPRYNQRKRFLENQLRSPLFRQLWLFLWSGVLTSLNLLKKLQKANKNTGNLTISGVFLVETTGLEPVTSCV